LTTIYFIRHAESDFAVREDSIRPLTVKGLFDSNKLAKYFQNIPVAAIYASPYKRVLQTVEKIAECKNLPILQILDLRERKIGVWLDNFTDYAVKQWTDFDYKLPNGESLREVQLRNVNALNSIIDKRIDDTIIIGTHGTALSTIINFFDQTFNYCQFYEIVDIMPLVVEMKFDNGNFLDYSIINEWKQKLING